METDNTVAILHEDVSENAAKDELDCLAMVQAVSDVLSKSGYSVVAIPFSLDIKGIVSKLEEVRPKFVFNLVDTVEGEGALLHIAPSILDHLGIRYTGGNTESLFITTNKVLTKQFLRSFGIPTAEWVTVEDGEQFIPNQKYIIKPVSEDASVGIDESCIVLAEKCSDLKAAIEKKQSDAGKAFFAERFIDGREFNISVMGSREKPEVLPIAEILFIGYDENNREKFVDYKAKWEEDSFEYVNTPRTFEIGENGSELTEKLRNLTEECWRSFGIKGYARVDYRVDKQGNPWVLEINVNPCIAPDSGFVAAAQQAGMNYTQLIHRIAAHL